MRRAEADLLIQFFRENLVTVTFSNPHASVYGLQFELAEPGKYRLTAGTDFNAYWCPYHSDSVNRVTLSGAADRMFTATMNGCSFGVGVAAPDGSVRVAHANTTEHERLTAMMMDTVAMMKPPSIKNTAFNNAVMSSQGSKQGSLKQALQLEQLKAALADKGDTLSNHISRAAYNGCTSITTFGLRVGQTWEFWFQGNIDGVVCGCFPFPKVNP